MYYLNLKNHKLYVSCEKLEGAIASDQLSLAKAAATPKSKIAELIGLRAYAVLTRDEAILWGAKFV